MNLLGVSLLALFSISYAGKINKGTSGNLVHKIGDDDGGYESGKVYEYNLKSYTVSGVPTLGNARSGIILWTSVKLSVIHEEHFSIQLENPVLRYIELKSDIVWPVDRVPDLQTALEDKTQFKTLPTEIQSTLDQFLTQPVFFTRDDDEASIKDIYAEKDLPEWILDMICGIIEKFQVKEIEEEDEEGMQVHNVIEDSIVGKNCNVTYDIMDHCEMEHCNFKTLTKVFTLDDCDNVAVYRDRFFSLQHKRNSFLQSSLATKMNVSEGEHGGYFIHDLTSEARYAGLSTIEAKTENIVYTRQELRFVQKSDLIVPLQSNNLEHKRDTVFTPLTLEKTLGQSNVYTGFANEEDNLHLIKNLAMTIVQSVESDTNPTFSLETIEEYQMMLSTLRFLRDPDSFKAILDFISHPHTELIRPMMINALASCGNRLLITSLPNIATTLDTQELNAILTGITIGAQSNEVTLRALKKLYVLMGNEKQEEESTKDQTLLAIGSQLHSLCNCHCKCRHNGDSLQDDCANCGCSCDSNLGEHNTHDDDCPCKKLRNEFSNFYLQEFARAKTTEQKTVILKAIGNSGLDMYHLVEEIVNNHDKYEMETRFNAIFALRRNPDKQKVRELLLAVFRNENNNCDVEMRVGSFSLLLDLFPTKEMLTSLVSQLNDETCKQLGNYVYSYLDNLVNMPLIFRSPEELHLAARTVLPTLKRFDDGIWYSKNLELLSRPMAEKLFNLFSLHTVMTNDQGLPGAIYVKLSQTLTNFYVDILDAGIRMEGADNLVQHLFSLVAKFLEENDGSAIVSELKHFQKMFFEQDEITPRPIEKTSGYLFTKAFGNELGVVRINPESVQKFLEDIVFKFLFLGKTSHLTIMPFLFGRQKVQTLMGVPTSVTWTSMSMTSIHTDNSKFTRATTLWGKDITVRNLFKNQLNFGVEIGGFKMSLGVIRHSRVILPQTILIGRDLKANKYGVELFWNSEDRVFKSGNIENFRLVEMKSVEMGLRHYLNEKTHDFEVAINEIEIHPLYLLNEEKYTFDVNGLRVTSIQAVDSAFKRGESPFDGRHIITVEFPRHEVKPYGLELNVDLSKFNKEKYNEVLLLATLNPRIPELSKQVDIKVKTGKQPTGTAGMTTGNGGPDLTLEITPPRLTHSDVYTSSNDVIRVFVTSEEIGARLFSLLPWMEAGEERQIDEILAVQWGVNEVYDKEDQDLVFKLRLGKSELQKKMELLDETLQCSDCERCKQDVKTQDPPLFDSISCSKCIMKRSTLSLVDVTTFTKKEYQHIVDYLIDLMKYTLAPYHNWVESHPIIDLVTPDLCHSEPTLLNKFMNNNTNMHNNNNDVIALRHIFDIHPRSTQMNITSFYRTSEMRFTRVPLLSSPIFKTPVADLPVEEITDFGVPLRYSGGLLYEDKMCRLDGNMTLETTDGVMIHLPKTLLTSASDSSCQLLLARDCTKDGTFELSALKTKNKNTVYLRTKTVEIKISPELGSFDIKINSKPIQMRTMQYQDGDGDILTYQTFETKEVAGEITPYGGPQKDDSDVTQLSLRLRGEGVKLVMVGNFVGFKAPFWYKNKLCGLCGDNNGEIFNDLVLKDMTVASTLEQFIDDYTKCS